MLHTFSEHTIEALWLRNSVRSQIIYIVVLLALLAAGVVACIVEIPVTVQARGIVRPLTERTEIKPVVSGKVTKIYICEGQSVQKGDTLLTIDSEKIRIGMAETQTEIAKQKSFVADLETMLSDDPQAKLQSTYYRARESTYRRRLFELETRLATAEKAYRRAETLFESRAIAPADMETEEQSYRSAVSEVELFKSERKASTEDELSRYRSSLNELESRLRQYHKELFDYTLLAPVSGAVEQFAGIYAGGYLLAGGTVAVVSPDVSLQIECYVQPGDIGFIRPNDTARVQVDAFNYTEWGMLNARTVAISDDYHVVDKLPMFRVRCIPDRDYLSLKNGFAGKIKKGMTVQVRFPVTGRTPYRLLFDKINDWMNPAQSARTYAVTPSE